MDSAKVRLSQALKEELKTKPLSKVSVSRLAEVAEVGRQTFYYHFNDIYDLVTWVFERDVAEQVMAHATYDEWANGFQQVLEYMEANRDQANAVMQSLSHREFELFFYSQFERMMQAVVDEVQGDLDVPEEARRLVINHYTIVVVGHLLHWLSRDMNDDPALLTQRIETVMRGNVRQALERFAPGADV